jgi:hypothetical protein
MKNNRAFIFVFRETGSTAQRHSIIFLSYALPDSDLFCMSLSFHKSAHLHFMPYFLPLSPHNDKRKMIRRYKTITK